MQLIRANPFFSDRIFQSLLVETSGNASEYQMEMRQSRGQGQNLRVNSYLKQCGVHQEASNKTSAKTLKK